LVLENDVLTPQGITLSSSIFFENNKKIKNTYFIDNPKSSKSIIEDCVKSQNMLGLDTYLQNSYSRFQVNGVIIKYGLVAYDVQIKITRINL